MRQAVVVGTGGQCRVIMSILLACNSHNVEALIELGAMRSGETIMGSSAIVEADYFSTLIGRSDLDVFLAIGDNTIRKYWWNQVKKMDLPLPNLISPCALVDDSAHLGESNVVCARAFLGPQASIGHNNLINTSAIIEHEVYIGHNCHLGPSSTIAGRSRIGDCCVLGAGSTIIDSISVASESIIGAGATLVTNIEQPGGVYVGTPAKRRVH